jgi:rubrerythrin
MKQENGGNEPQYRQRGFNMNVKPDSHTHGFTVRQLLSHALAIETEAAHSYAELADLMKQAGNPDTARVFEKMSAIEARHAMVINDQVGLLRLPLLNSWQFSWAGLEPPENIDRAQLSPAMGSRRALELALEGERRAYDFFCTVVDDSVDRQVRKFAAEFAAEEEEHIFWIREWLYRS